MNNQRKSRQKRTHMSAAQLRQKRLEIGFDMRAMAAALGDMPYRTYQCYEYGDRGIPRKVADQVRRLHKQDRQFMRQLRLTMDRELARQFPGGISSAADHPMEVD